MITFLKYLLLAIVTLIGGYIAVMVVIGFVFFHDAPSCASDSEAVKYARSIDSDRLEKMYQDMERFYHRDDVPSQGYDVYSEAGLPEEFSDLRIQRVRPKQTHIMVQGCFDNYMYLQFEGIEKSVSKKIYLTYGDHDVTKELLWPLP